MSQYVMSCVLPFRFHVSNSQASPIHDGPQHLCNQTAELVDVIIYLVH